LDTTGQKVTRILIPFTADSNFVEKQVLKLLSYDKTATINFFLWGNHKIPNIKWSVIEENLRYSNSAYIFNKACDEAIEALYHFKNVKPVVDYYRKSLGEILWD
jgi:hypothetical protein